jgi:hypothetical protein
LFSNCCGSQPALEGATIAEGLLPLWDHAGHVQNDGGDGEGEESDSEGEEQVVGHCGVSVCCPAGCALTNKLQKIYSKNRPHFLGVLFDAITHKATALQKMQFQLSRLKPGGHFGSQSMSLIPACSNVNCVGAVIFWTNARRAANCQTSRSLGRRIAANIATIKLCVQDRQH